jgi:hypothetical protein
LIAIISRNPCVPRALAGESRAARIGDRRPAIDRR